MFPVFISALFRPRDHWLPVFVGLLVSSIGVTTLSFAKVNTGIAPGIIMVIISVAINLVGQFVVRKNGVHVCVLVAFTNDLDPGQQQRS